uniref:PAZ domain-containing protein n=1 Tax=Caenorhabditis tropicalis TaxID=1561998 RepID=A0A1I7U6W6_9PELO
MSTPVGSSGPSTSTPEGPSTSTSAGPSTSTSEGSSTSTSAGPSTSTLHVPSSSRNQLPSPTGSSTENAFREKERCKVQMNLFKVDISGMPEKVVRLSMLTTLCFEKCFLRLSNVHNHFSGGLNATNRRVALRVIFRKIFARHPIIFGTDINKYAFDGATTIYAIDYKGGNLKILETLAEKDFNKEEWAQVSRIVRKPETRFEVVISANGFVYSRGQEYESIENHKELIKLIDAVSSENRNEPGIFHHGRRQTFHYKDRLRNITKGFFKSTRWLTNCEIAMVLDYVQTPFYDETSVLKLLTLKYDEFSGIAPIQIPRDQGQRDRDQREQRAHRDEQDSRDFRGHRGHEGRREGRSKSRSPIQAPEQPVQEAPDYDETKVIEVQTAFKDERHPEIFKDIARYMKGIIVEPTHLSAEYNRNVVIAGFSVLNAKEQKFIKKEGTEIKRITVVEYFKSKHNITIKFPDLPLIVTGKGKRRRISQWNY